MVFSSFFLVCDSFSSRRLSRLERPSAAERLVESDERLEPTEACLRERVLGGEELLLGVEHLHIAREAGAVSDVREAHGLLIRGDRKRLFPFGRREVLI